MKKIYLPFIVLSFLSWQSCNQCDAEIEGTIILNSELESFNFESIGETITFSDGPAELDFVVTEYTNGERNFFVGDECPDGVEEAVFFKIESSLLDQFIEVEFDDKDLISIKSRILTGGNRLVDFYSTGSDIEIIRDYEEDGITSELAFICTNDITDDGEINKVIVTKEEGIKEFVIESRVYRK